MGMNRVGVASAAVACSATRTSTMNVTGRASEYEYVTYISNGGVVTTSPRMMIRSNVNTGYSAITVTSCKNPKAGVWSALTYSTQSAQKVLS